MQGEKRLSASHFPEKSATISGEIMSLLGPHRPVEKG
jgi:hypothetical protein